MSSKFCERPLACQVGSCVVVVPEVRCTLALATVFAPTVAAADIENPPKPLGMFSIETSLQLFYRQPRFPAAPHLALLLWAAAPEWWWVAAAGLVLRAAAGAATAGLALRDPLVARLWWAVPAQDVASFLGWLGGFFGNTIVWRGRKYYLRRNGRFELIQD